MSTPSPECRRYLGGNLGHSIAIDPTDDNILATGYGVVSGQIVKDIFVTRVLANGSSSDPTFGQSGIAQAGFSPVLIDPGSVALTPDGKIVVSGIDNSGLPIQPEVRTVRFLGGSSSTPQIANAAIRPTVTAMAADPTSMPLVLGDNPFVNLVVSNKRRRAN